MGATDAERQRRRRAHLRGDHSTCSPDRCRPGDVTPPVTAVTVPREPADGAARAPQLGTRGRWLWRQLVDGAAPTPAQRLLIEEACRLADRLDILDRILRGDEDTWLRLQSASLDGSVVKVIVNGALAEARQQQVALKQLLGELRQAAAAAPATPQGQGGSIRDQLAAARARRLADAAGR